MGRTYGENWKDAREQAGFSSPQGVADTLAALYPREPKKQLSRNYIYQLERDAANPTLEVMQLLADTYGVPLARIFTIGAVATEVPVEYRPLDSVLRPYDRASREGIVRNLAASLAMQQRVFSTGHAVTNSGDSEGFATLERVVEFDDEDRIRGAR